MNERTDIVKRAIATLFLACVSVAALAFDPFAIGPDDTPRTDDECLAQTLLYCDASAPWKFSLNSFAKKLGNEKVGEKIIEFMDPVFEAACSSSYPEKEYKLCWSGLHALGHLRATNSLPFLEKAVLNGSAELSHTALISYRIITGADDSYIAFLDKALDEGYLTRGCYTSEIGFHYWEIHNGEKTTTPENWLKTAVRLMNNPHVFYLDCLDDDNMLLADFPVYTNSVERLAALSAFLDNENTPPDVRAKYKPERDRLKALPPESLVRVTDELEAQLDALLKAAERKRKIEQVKKYAVPAGAAVLVLGVLAVLFNRHPRR